MCSSESGFTKDLYSLNQKDSANGTNKILSPIFSDSIELHHLVSLQVITTVRNLVYYITKFCQNFIIDVGINLTHFHNWKLLHINSSTFAPNHLQTWKLSTT